MSRKNNVVTLVAETKTVNEVNDTITETTRRETFAEKMSVRGSEYYQGAAAGMKPEVVFRIWRIEYQGEQTVEHDGQSYSVIRTFEVDEKDIDLVCEGLAKR